LSIRCLKRRRTRVKWIACCRSKFRC
jgi:hypothetical protein